MRMKTKCAKQPLVSVIVPVYKVEAYLQTCVDSILEQPYEMSRSFLWTMVRQIAAR